MSMLSRGVMRIVGSGRGSSRAGVWPGRGDCCRGGRRRACGQVPGRQAGLLGHDHREQGVGRDVEGDAEEDVGAALVELAVEVCRGLARAVLAWRALRRGTDVELKHGVAFGEVP